MANRSEMADALERSVPELEIDSTTSPARPHPLRSDCCVRMLLTRGSNRILTRSCRRQRRRLLIDCRLSLIMAENNWDFMWKENGPLSCRILHFWQPVRWQTFNFLTKRSQAKRCRVRLRSSVRLPGKVFTLPKLCKIGYKSNTNVGRHFDWYYFRPRAPTRTPTKRWPTEQ